MTSVQYVKSSSLLLLFIIPLSIIGYIFAIHNEDLFFLYEWAIVILVLCSGILAFMGSVKAKDKLKWILFSVLAFTVQISVLGLFLGPFSIYPMFFVYYMITFISLGIYVTSLLNATRFKSIVTILIVVSGLLTIYMIFLHGLWGTDWS